MPMKYKLIVTDLDGTLLNEERIVPQYTKDLIKKFRDSGGMFSIATGRIEMSVRKYWKELGIDVPVILYNGAKIINLNDNTIYFESKLNYDITRIALRKLKSYKWDVLVYKDNNIYISKCTDGIGKYMLKDGVTCVEVGDLAKYIESSPTKILIIGDWEKFNEFVKLSSDEFGSPINAVRSEMFYLEILPDNVSKGRALEELCRILDIKLCETIAIGDHLNDIDMIKKAGLGVAVSNADKKLKMYADYVASGNNTQGVSEVIKMVLENQL